MEEIWNNVLAKIEQEISPVNFNTWFTDVTLISIQNGIVTIETPNVFKLKNISKRYYNNIKNALKANNIDFTEIQFVKQTKKRSKNQSADRKVITPQNTKKTHKTQINPYLSTGLNDHYTMENFVIGSNNDLAVSIADNIIKRPGNKMNNPFFLYGGPGLGKTHLAQAIGNAIIKNNPELKVLYIPINHFYSEFIDSIKNQKADEFPKKFRKLDVLIVDDFQLIVGKSRSQEEFFNIFNDLHQMDKQIIVTSDRLPSQIKTVDERLASRLTWGQTVDLQMPNFEDKCAILKSKADFMGVEIEDEAVEYLADNVRTNIRDLESEFNHLLAIADFKNMTPFAVINEGYVKPQTATNQTLSPKEIVSTVAKYYDLTVKELSSKSRVSHIKNARQVAMFLLSEELSLSTPKIAMEVGVKDHTTVMHGIKRIKNELKLNFGLREQLANIREKLYA